MTGRQRAGNREIGAALAAITGRSLTDVNDEFMREVTEPEDETSATSDDIRSLVSRVKTRLGLAPAVDSAQSAALGITLNALASGEMTMTRGEVSAWGRMFRHLVEHIRTIDREPVQIPKLPEHQMQMWRTVIEFESIGQPWVLVGGQMVMLHCLEHGVSSVRPTDDGDIIVGVWTRRDALRKATQFLRERGFSEVKTSDGYGYRYRRGERTVIDLLLPEGLERQRHYPTTVSGRPGFSADGGNQALARAERIPVAAEGIVGYVRRPTILGSIVAKAYAWMADGRDTDRHAQDIVTLALVGLDDPRSVLKDASSADRKIVRAFLRGNTADSAIFRSAGDERDAVFNILVRLAASGH